MAATLTTPCITSTSTGPCSQGSDLDGGGTLRHSGLTSRRRFGGCFSRASGGASRYRERSRVRLRPRKRAGGAGDRAIVNANPEAALSWASYLMDYGGWGPGRTSGQLEQTLKYNGAYRRDVLLELGDRLDDLLDANNEELWPILHRQGYYSCFD